MLNKKLLYETLKKEMEAKQESKAIQRKLRPIEQLATDPELLKKQATKEEEKQKKILGRAERGGEKSRYREEADGKGESEGK